VISTTIAAFDAADTAFAPTRLLLAMGAHTLFAGTCHVALGLGVSPEIAALLFPRVGLFASGA
jgi:hypothetical protein